MDERKTCIVCGKEFKKSRGVTNKKWAVQKYCSAKCYYESNRKKLKQTKICKTCGKRFERQSWTSQKVWAKQSFCSKKCHYDVGRVEAVCKNCGKTFLAHKYRKDSIEFCGQSCYSEYRKKFSEQYSGFKTGHEAFITTPWLGKKHSEETKQKISKSLKGNPKVLARAKQFAETHSGEDHWNWKGGVTSEMQKIRHSREYDEWRFAVYKRDNYTCQHCKKKCRGREIVAHHLKNFKDFPKERFDISNGITLCRKCHKIVHKEIGGETRFKKEMME